MIVDSFFVEQECAADEIRFNVHALSDPARSWIGTVARVDLATHPIINSAEVLARVFAELAAECPRPMPITDGSRIRYESSRGRISPPIPQITSAVQVAIPPGERHPRLVISVIRGPQVDQVDIPLIPRPGDAPVSRTIAARITSLEERIASLERENQAIRDTIDFIYYTIDAPIPRADNVIDVQSARAAYIMPDYVYFVGREPPADGDQVRWCSKKHLRAVCSSKARLANKGNSHHVIARCANLTHLYIADGATIPRYLPRTITHIRVPDIARSGLLGANAGAVPNLRIVVIPESAACRLADFRRQFPLAQLIDESGRQYVPPSSPSVMFAIPPTPTPSPVDMRVDNHT